MNIKEKKQLEEYVKRGAEFLDEMVPGWYRKINLRKLDISDQERCICGQLEYKFHARDVPYDLPATLGFRHKWGGEAEYDLMTEMWRVHIKMRRGEKS